MHKYIKFLYLSYTSRIGRDLALPFWHFFSTLIGSLCFFYFHLISFGFIVSKFTFTGWTTQELYILFFTFEIYTYLAFLLFYRGFLLTNRWINTGQLDTILAKPINSWVLSFLQGGGLHNLIAAVLGFIYLVISLFKYSLNFSLFSFILYFLSLILSLLFLVCFTATFISLNFIFGNIQVAGIGFSLQDIMKYPTQIFPKTWLIILLIIPFSSLVTIPTSLLINKPIELVTLITYLGSILVVTVFSALMWHVGIRHYSSAS